MDKRRLTRSETDRMIGGVCGGVAEHLEIDPTLVRIAFLVLAMMGGTGVALYLAMWLLVPRSSQSSAPPRDVLRDNVAEGRRFAEDTARAAKDAFERLRSEGGTDGFEEPPSGGTAGTGSAPQSAGSPPSRDELSAVDEPPPTGGEPPQDDAPPPPRTP